MNIYKYRKLLREITLWLLAISMAVPTVYYVPEKLGFEPFVEETRAGISPLSSSGVGFWGETGTPGTLRVRTFSGTATWNAIFSGPASTASNILHMVARVAPTREEMMIGHLKVDGRLDIVTCTTGCDDTADFTARWNNPGTTATQDCDSAPTLGTCEQAFDIGYEALSGRAMVVYGDNVADRAYYALWNGSGWSPNTTPGTPGASNEINLPGAAGTPEWIRVIPAGDNLADDRSNRMMILIADTNADLFAFYWNGSAFDAGTTIELSLQNRDRGRAFDGSWQGNNIFIISYGDADAVNDIKYRKFVVGSGWEGEIQAYTTAGAAYWVESRADPTSTRIYVTTADRSEDTRGAVWRANNVDDGWTVCSGDCPDLTIETVAGMQASGAFERFGGEALHVFSDAAGNSVSAQAWTYAPPSTWNTRAAIGFTAADDGQSIRAWGQPNSDDVMVLMSDIDCDLYARQWNGAGFDAVNNDITSILSMTNGGCAQGTAVEGAGVGYGYDFVYKVYTPWQRNWRFYSGTDTASTPTISLAAQNTTPTGITDGQRVRLRINYAERGRSISNTNARKRLQFTSGCDPNTDPLACTWADVDNPGGSAIWRYFDPICSPTDCADNTVLTGTVLTGSSTCSQGLGCGTWVLNKDAAGGTNMDHTAQAAADTIQESEWIIEANNATAGETYYFRIYNNDQETPLFREQDENDCGTGGTDACTYPSLTMLKTDQLNYRWRNDDGAEDAGTSLVAQDTPLSGMLRNTNYRLRFLVNVTGGNAGTYSYRIEYAARVGASCDTDESYTAVPDTPSGGEHFEMTLTSNYIDQAFSTNVSTGAGVISDPGGSSFPANQGKLVEETSNAADSVTLNNSQFTEMEYNFIANNNSTYSGNYCFRLTNGGTALSTYTRYAAVQIQAAPGPTTDQVMRHGNWFSGGVEQSFFWAD